MSYLMIALPFVLVLVLWVLTFLYLAGIWFYVACTILTLISFGLLIALWLLSNLHIH